VSRPPNRRLLQPFLCTGLCGALTTFSALQVEVIELARNGRPVLAASYLTVSIALGLLVVAIVARTVRPRVSHS
jgi:fluoride exporter